MLLLRKAILTVGIFCVIPFKNVEASKDVAKSHTKGKTPDEVSLILVIYNILVNGHLCEIQGVPKRIGLFFDTP